MNEHPRPRRRAVQHRAVATKAQIAAGALAVLAEAGAAGLTHRAVARAAKVSLAATTYHFASKAALIEEASKALLDDYLAAFRRLEARIADGAETEVAGLGDLVARVVLNALGRDRTRSLAWCELVLHGGRSTDGRALARNWYDELDSIWHGIARLLDAPAARDQASRAVDLTVGITFCLHPLALTRPAAVELLAGRADFAALLIDRTEGAGGRDATAARPDGGARDRRAAERVLEAAIGIVAQEGVGALSYGSVAAAAGMARSGPSYYFPTMEGLLSAAQAALFERAKQRYRAGFALQEPGDVDEGRLLDLTTAIFFREALEFGRENVGHYSVWMSAARNPSVRPAVAASLLDQHRAWSRRVAALGGAEDPALAFRMQALFIGKLVRAIVTTADVGELSRSRDDFAAALAGYPPLNGTFV
jgi:AcrR family transcriptional regulator